jgi:hypothetical protein
LFCFIFLLLAAAGPGKLALDNLLFRKSEELEEPNVAQRSEEG